MKLEKLLKVKKIINNNELKFVKGDLIGEGTFGTVFQGLDLQNGHILAIKEILLSPI